jgi:alkanesulfonate monooxygenase SsuD/methylene tetrahydromethanopterin reductase-like flavin-dependent oxidoreductase (luciferase family)
LGRPVGSDSVRRQAVEAAVMTLRTVWSGTVSGVSGFLRPEPPPPIVIGGVGPKMAELAGRVGDGINTPGGRGLARLVDIARRACEHSGRDPGAFLVTASGAPSDADRLAASGVDRMIIHVGAPYGDDVARARKALG